MTLALGKNAASPWRVFVILASVLTGAVAIVAYLVPLNCNDFLQHLIHFDTYSLQNTFERYFLRERPGASDWRPLQYLTSQALYLYVAKGHEHLVFKGLLSVCVVATAWLFVRLTPVQSWRDLVAALTALMILFAHQSFAGAIEGVYPYGVEIILVICELYVLGVLIRGRPTLGSEIAIVALSVFLVLLNEKGGFVGGIYILGAILRLPGASRRAALALVVAFAAVLAVRFAFYVGLAAMGRRSGALSAGDVVFNLTAPALNLLISDPRFGNFRTFPQAFVLGHEWAIVTVVTSVLTLVLITTWAILTFKRRSISTELRVAALLPVLLVGSMAFGPFSQKDYVPIMALPVYALVTFYALRWLFAQDVAEIAVVVGVVLFVGWGIRTTGLFYYMHRVAYTNQDEWREGERHARFSIYPRSIAMPLLERLRAEVLAKPYVYTDELLPKGMDRWFRGRGCPEFC